MNTSIILYLCPHCFYASDVPDERHEHPLVRMEPGPPGDERPKPITDRHGQILSPAPRWFHEAVIQARMAAPGLMNPPQEFPSPLRRLA